MLTDRSCRGAQYVIYAESAVPVPITYPLRPPQGKTKTLAVDVTPAFKNILICILIKEKLCLFLKVYRRTRNL